MGTLTVVGGTLTPVGGAIPGLSTALEVASFEYDRTTSSATSITAVMPSGIEVGDLLLVFICRGSASSTAPDRSGWTREYSVTHNASGWSGVDLHSRIADGSEAASYGFSWSGFSYTGVFVARIPGGSTIRNVDNQTDNATRLAGETHPSVDALEGSLFVQVGYMEGSPLATDIGFPDDADPLSDLFGASIRAGSFVAAGGETGTQQTTFAPSDDFRSMTSMLVEIAA